MPVCGSRFVVTRQSRLMEGGRWSEEEKEIWVPDDAAELWT